MAIKIVVPNVGERLEAAVVGTAHNELPRREAVRPGKGVAT